MQTQAQNASVPASRKGGPKTEAGKNRSRFNAFRHGLTGRTVVMPWEDLEQYRAFCRRMMDDLKPVGAREEQYAQEIVDCSWRLNRAAAGENNLFAYHLHQMEGKVNSGDEEIDAAIIQGMMFRAESGTLLNISLYCNRIANQRARSEKRLQELQEKREAKQDDGMRRAAVLYRRTPRRRRRRR